MAIPEAWSDTSYRTMRHRIPFGLYWLYSRAMDAIEARNRVSDAKAFGHVVSQAFGAKDAGLPKGLIRDLKDAFLSNGTG